MVVYDRHLVARLQKPQILDLLGSVGIDYDQQGFAVGGEHCFLCAYEDILVFRSLFKHLDKRLCQCLFRIGNNVHPHAVFACNEAHGNGCSDAVHIAVTVTHDENLRSVLNERSKCVCHYAGFDLCSGIALADLAAEEIKVKAVFDDRLIAAAAKCHIRRQHRKLECLAEICSVSAYAYAQCRMNAGGVCYLMNLVEKPELVLDYALHVPLLKDHEIAVTVKADEDAVLIFAP